MFYRTIVIAVWTFLNMSCLQENGIRCEHLLGTRTYCDVGLLFYTPKNVLKSFYLYTDLKS